MQILTEIESLQSRGIHCGLKTMQQALELLGHPEKEFPSIHIAGTNGKGSTSAMLAEILKQAGYKTGFTLSPHILDYRERIQINGEWIKIPVLTELHHQIKKLGLDLTYFEWTILLAFLYFASEKVDIAILETGMGGRWDATNTVLPLIGAITNVSLDHQAYLGNTLEAILTEKMQILKPKMIAWTGICEPSLKKILWDHCKKNQVELFFLDDFLNITNEGVSLAEWTNIQPGLLGAHQLRNTGLALGIAHSLKKLGFRIPDEAIHRGVNEVFWPGRLELIQTKPRILLDGAHNIAGINTLVDYLKTQPEKYHLVFGTRPDKPAEAMLERLKPFCKSIHVKAFDKNSFRSFLQGIPPEDRVLVTGSLYLVAAIRPWVL